MMIGTVFMDIAEEWRNIDRFLMNYERLGIADQAGLETETLKIQRSRNDQAYFLYIFTRFEKCVDEAVDHIVQNRTQDADWAERRIWQAWYGTSRRRPEFMRKVEILFDKNRNNFKTIQYYHKIRNEIAHGGEWTEQLAIPQVAEAIDSLVSDFPTT